MALTPTVRKVYDQRTGPAPEGLYPVHRAFRRRFMGLPGT